MNNSLELTDTYIFNIYEEEKKEEDEYIKSCSRKTRKEELRALIEKLTDYSTKKLDDTVEEVKKLLSL